MYCTILPPYITAKIDPKQLIIDAQIRARRSIVSEFRDLLVQPEAHKEVRQLYDSNHTFNFPPTPIKEDIQHHSSEPSDDPILQIANIIYDHFHDKLNRESWDNKNATVKIFINYGNKYNNAFWDSKNLAFGNGDGQYFNSFLIDDIVGHEFAHAVTDTSAGLIYYGQSGALNEHFSDVVGISIKHLINGNNNNWLLGEGLFNSSINARGLRDMENPGTAYDDNRIGKDPQPNHIDDYYTGTDDNQGVHLNSGIINKVFSTFVKTSNSKSFELPLNIWYNTLLKCNNNTQFQEFANINVEVASNTDNSIIQKLIDAWNIVGIEVNDPRPEPEPEPENCCKVIKQIKNLLNKVNT